jgi:hypothetical protein
MYQHERKEEDEWLQKKAAFCCYSIAIKVDLCTTQSQQSSPPVPRRPLFILHIYMCVKFEKDAEDFSTALSKFRFELQSTGTPSVPAGVGDKAAGQRPTESELKV